MVELQKIVGALLLALALIVAINLGGDFLDHMLSPPAPRAMAR